MSKYMSYICDICGTEIVGHSAHAVAEESARIKLWPPGAYRAGPGQNIDLCQECFNRFVSFLETAKSESEDNFE